MSFAVIEQNATGGLVSVTIDHETGGKNVPYATQATAQRNADYFQSRNTANKFTVVPCKGFRLFNN